MGKSINLPETDGVRPQEDFLVACKALDPEYATTCLRDVYRAENCGTTDSLPTLDDYVAEFTAFLRRNRPRSSGLATVAADLKVAAPFNEEQDDAFNSKNNSNDRNNSKNVPKCLCGMKHWYSDCFIINEEHPRRPVNYKAPQAAQKKVEEARRNPQVESKILSTLDRWRKRHQKSSTLQIDDGLPPSNYDMYIMSIGNSLDTSSATENIGLQVGGEPRNEIDEKDMDDADLSNQYQSQHRLLTPIPSEFGDNSENRSNIDASTISETPVYQPQSVEQSAALDPVAIPVGYPVHSEALSRRINLNPYDTSLIVSGKRNRKKAPDPNVFAISTHVMTLGALPLKTYLYTFAAETSKYSMAANIPRVHQSQLPPPPKNFRALDKHIFDRQFKQALAKEWESLQQKGYFRRTHLTKATADSEVLPLMWVFTYKTSEEGYLASFKVRLVVRGDLQEPLENTYAATLAIRNFRALIAIANYFDLELKQYDVPTAFLNAKLNRKLFVETPDGLRNSEGEILEVLLALYGLKESPLLWYEELKKNTHQYRT